MGKRVAVVGAGNTAMDACRVSLRMGAEIGDRACTAARAANRRRASRNWSTPSKRASSSCGSPPRWRSWAIASGWVTGMRVPEDGAGRAGCFRDGGGPCRCQGSEFLIDVDTVIYALGTTANPIIAQTTPGLKINKWGYIAGGRAHRDDLDSGPVRGRRYRHRRGHRDSGHGRRQAGGQGHAGIHGNSDADDAAENWRRQGAN